MKLAPRKKEGFVSKRLYEVLRKLKPQMPTLGNIPGKRNGINKVLDVEKCILVERHVTSTEVRDKIAKVSWGQTAEVFKCHARDPGVERIFFFS